MQSQQQQYFYSKPLGGTDVSSQVNSVFFTLVTNLIWQENRQAESVKPG